MSDLPPGWEWATLENIGQIQGGIQKQAKRRPVKNRYPFLRVANVSRGEVDLSQVHEIELFDGEIERYRLQVGDLLVVEGNGSLSQLGRAAMWRNQIPDCVHQNHLIRVRPDRGVESAYLTHAWNSEIIIRQLERLGASTSGLHTLSVSKIRPICIPLPPTAEQKRIVTALEDHLSRLDAAVGCLAGAGGRLTSLVAAMRNAEIGDPSDNYGHLADVLDRIEAGKSFGSSARPAAEDEWGIIKVSAMTWGEFRPSENKFVSDDKRVDPRYEIRPGDILVSRANTEQYVGAPVLVRSTRPKLLLSDKSLRLVPRSGIDHDWLLEVLASPLVRKQISKKATGTKDSMRNISQASLKEIRIPLHEADRQCDVAAVLAERREAVQRLDSGLTTAAALGSRLRRSLLTDAFAGRLVPQDPNDEPASVLLERIHAERAAQPKSRRIQRSRQPDTTQEALL